MDEKKNNTWCSNISSSETEKKVAAYIRVSTSNEEQLISLEAQRRHYKTLIEKNDDWQLVDIDSDEGITGTKKDRRPELLRLMSDCEKGKVYRVSPMFIMRE